MGETYVNVRMYNPDNERSELLGMLVDTGSAYTQLPEGIIRRLGIEALGIGEFELANGSVIWRNVGNVFIEIEGIQGMEGMRRGVPYLTSGDDATKSLLGYIALETFGVMVDPLRQTLVKKIIPLYRQ